MLQNTCVHGVLAPLVMPLQQRPEAGVSLPVLGQGRWHKGVPKAAETLQELQEKRC